MLDKIEVYITIVAAIIIGVITVFDNVTFQDILTRFIIVIAVSYSLAVLLKLYIKRFVVEENIENNKNTKDNKNTDEPEDTNDDLSIEIEEEAQHNDEGYTDSNEKIDKEEMV